MQIIGPQPGPQTAFLSTSADIAIYGGEAGGGKSYALMLEPTRHLNVPGFGGVIFRHTVPEITNQGGLWDESFNIYANIRSKSGQAPIPHGEPRLRWIFPPHGNKIKFASLQLDIDRLKWQGSQIPFIGWDELTHFSLSQFTYVTFSRGRTTCGVKPYTRATCNPDSTHFLREWLRWWIDDGTGLAIPERSGVIRYMTMVSGELVWGATREECAKKSGRKPKDVKSFTFIHASVYDNKILLAKDDGYIGGLMALPKLEQEQLLGGNWNAKAGERMWFRKEWFSTVDTLPSNLEMVRYWDPGSVEDKKTDGLGTKGPSWTAGLLMGRDFKTPPSYYICDLSHFTGTPGKVETTQKNLAEQDDIRYGSVTVGIEQEPGRAGKARAQHEAKLLHKHATWINKVTENKGKRARPLSGQCRAGNVFVLAGPWNETLFSGLESFNGTDKPHADIADAASGAFNFLEGGGFAGGISGI